MAIPDFQTVMLPALRVIGEAGEEEIAIAHIVERSEAEFQLTAEELSATVPSGGTRLIKDRITWAVSYLLKAGLIMRPRRAHYVISDDGKRLLQKPPPRIDINVLRQFDAFRQWEQKPRPKRSAATPEEASPDKEESSTPEERIGQARQDIEDGLRTDLLDSILEISPRAFEQLIIKLMLAMGYGYDENSGLHTGKSGDGGVDGIINEDELGLGKIYLQAKRYAADNKVAGNDIRAFGGAMDEQGVTKGVFVTTSSFTDHALASARNSPKSLTLIDGERLANLLIKFNVAVREQSNIRIMRIDNDFLEELG